LPRPKSQDSSMRLRPGSNVSSLKNTSLICPVLITAKNEHFSTFFEWTAARSDSVPINSSCSGANWFLQLNKIYV